ncbi:MAG: glucosaminidase domain-containing protein [Bacteroides sp.]|nr:glucosaminidase domain-containing protein [Bacteroides sp.]
MKLVYITLCIAALLTASAADGRAHKRKKTRAPEPWPEEVPDFKTDTASTPQTAAEEIEPQVVVIDVFAGLTDDELVEQMIGTSIFGEPEISAEAMERFVARNNPDFNPEIARAYITVGRRYGIRGDIALCQSILETGWFKFADGTKVTPDQHNYCGLGVLKLGQRGHSFSTVEEGVTAQIQHLYAYACNMPLPEGESIIDPRFKLVARGVATTWQELSGRWAANDRYARSIMKLFVQLQRFSSEQ